MNLKFIYLNIFFPRFSSKSVLRHTFQFAFPSDAGIWLLVCSKSKKIFDLVIFFGTFFNAWFGINYYLVHVWGV